MKSALSQLWIIGARWTLGLLVLVTLSACARKQPSDVVATVGNRTVTANQLQAEAKRREAAGRNVPDKKGLLDEMIAFEALVDRAYSTGLADAPDVRRELSALLAGKLIDREVESRRSAVSDEAVKTEYEANLSRYSRPAKARLAILHLEANKKTSVARQQELRARLQTAREKFLSLPADARKEGLRPGFGPLARDFSDDQTSRYRGGDIGWIDENKFVSRLPRKLLEAAFKLQVGEVSELIEAENGFYLVTKTDFEPGYTTPLSQVQGAIRQALLAKNERELHEAFRQETLKRAVIKINEATLAALELPATQLVASASKDVPPGLGPAGIGSIEEKRNP